jgi:hypothetical protein
MSRIQNNDIATFAAKRTEDLQGLSLPTIGIDRETEARDFWSVQNYHKFAESVQRKNPNIALTKETVDSAFGLVISRMGKNVGSLKGRDSAVARVSHNGCLKSRQPY